MGYIGQVLDSVVSKLSDENYVESIAFYRLWFDIGQTYLGITSDRAYDAIWSRRGDGSINSADGKLIHSAADLIVRFACNVAAEPESIPAPRTSGLPSRLSTTSLQEFFSDNLMVVYYKENTDENGPVGNFYTNVNLIARWANLGYVEEVAICNHILQSLISHPKLYDHQADALVILFKLAGATFEAYAEPSVVDRCFQLFQYHEYYHSGRIAFWFKDQIHAYDRMKREPVQEVVALRKRGWEGLPPPPVFTTRKVEPTGAIRNDPAATPVATSLGLPNRELEPQIPQPHPPEPVTVPQSVSIPASPPTPVIQSPSISIATLSDFTIADTSDDESSINPTIVDASDDDPPIDPTVITPHGIFYLEDGNAEVLCGNTLFRVHPTILSFHSSTLCQMFAQTNLKVAESPNGCPRIQCSDTPNDFATLLKVVYLPGFPERNKVPDFITFSSLLRITAKYDMPAVRSQLLEVVHDAYPETFEGLGPSKPLGENVFSGPTPHPNEVLNLFVQQKLTSALPMAYYMAARKGLDSLMDERLPASARLSLEILRVAIRGLMALREIELDETHSLIFGPTGSRPCSASNCPSRTPTGPVALEAYRKVLEHIVAPSRSGRTNLLQVPEFYEDRGGDVQCICPGICSSCVERWESGHAELRKKAWTMLPDIFGLKS